MHKEDTIIIKDLFSENEETSSVLLVMYDISDVPQLNAFRDFLTQQLDFDPVQDSVYCCSGCDTLLYNSLIGYINSNLQPKTGDYVDVRIIELHPSNILEEVIWGDG